MLITLNKNQYLELEKLHIGSFSPLQGFMNEKELHSVANEMRLPNGSIFPLPVVFDISREEFAGIRDQNKVDLYYNGKKVGCIIPNDFYECDRKNIAKKIYGTDSIAHPGVAYFYDLKPIFVGGRVEMYERPNFEFLAYEYTPNETKKIFHELNWHSVVGFQTRNVPHRAHEYLLRVALEVADGLFIQPLVGYKKAGDFSPSAILAGYEALIRGYLPIKKVLLGTLSTVMRYAGPREAIFHAIVRRNYGCTHFIIGRDHAGVGDWYGLYDAHELSRRFDGELGINILRLNGPYFCSKCDTIATISSCSHEGTEFVQHISGTYMRSLLQLGKTPDSHLMRKDVLDALSSTDCFIS